MIFMKVEEEIFKEFIGKTLSIEIPKFQRTYSWKDEQLKEIWDDIIKVGETEKIKKHFIGSIIYSKEANNNTADSRQFLHIIDGQQRITTLTILACSLCRFKNIEKKDKEILKNYLVNQDKERKLFLRSEDDKTLKKIIDSIIYDKELILSNDDSINIKKAYYFFDRKIKKTNNYKVILTGIGKLSFISIELDNKYDDPQLIFSSLNSTGRGLTPSDLVRNYILMNAEDQDDLYEKYWESIEKGFKDNEKNKNGNFDDFIKCYLTIKSNKKVSKNYYKEFKFYKDKNFNENIEPLLEDLNKYANYYFNIVFEKEDDKELKEIFKNFNLLRSQISHTFLINMYDDYQMSKSTNSNINLSKEDFINIVKVLESYILRRNIYYKGDSKNNNIKLSLYQNIDKNDYLNSFIAYLLHYPPNDKQRFPSDDEFKEKVLKGEVYELKSYHQEAIAKRLDLKNINKIESEELFNNMEKIWKYPEKNEKIVEIINNFKNNSYKEKNDYSKYLEGETYTKNLMDSLNNKILKEFKDVEKIENFRTFVAYKPTKNNKNFIKVKPLEEKLKIILDVKTKDLEDPTNLCKDVSEKKGDPRGNTRLYFENIDNIDNIFNILKQAYEKI